MTIWQAVFFDFDGVILDSVHVKTSAFAKLFRDYGPEVEKQVVEYHLANGGVSRYEKFRYYYETLLERPISETTLEELGHNFSNLVVQEVLSAPFIDGALETLNGLYDKNIPAFVVSGTPQDELVHIVNMKGLEKYFKEVHGSPRNKHEIVMDIQSRYHFHLAECIFIGDAMTDYKAAKKAKTPFLGIVKKDDSSPFPKDVNISPFVDIYFNQKA